MHFDICTMSQARLLIYCICILLSHKKEELSVPLFEVERQLGSREKGVLPPSSSTKSMRDLARGLVFWRSASSR